MLSSKHPGFFFFLRQAYFFLCRGNKKAKRQPLLCCLKTVWRRRSSITFYIVLITSDVCWDVCVGAGGWGGWAGRGALPACLHSSHGGEEERVSGPRRQTPPLSFPSFLHRLRQRLGRIYIISVRHGATICLLRRLSEVLKFDPGKHSQRHMLLFLPSERLMGLIHNFELATQLWI